jgi:predicted transcriptional regulator
MKIDTIKFVIMTCLTEENIATEQGRFPFIPEIYDLGFPQSLLLQALNELQDEGYTDTHSIGRESEIRLTDKGIDFMSRASNASAG